MSLYMHLPIFRVPLIKKDESQVEKYITTKIKDGVTLDECKALMKELRELFFCSSVKSIGVNTVEGGIKQVLKKLVEKSDPVFQEINRYFNDTAVSLRDRSISFNSRSDAFERDEEEQGNQVIVRGDSVQPEIKESDKSIVLFMLLGLIVQRRDEDGCIGPVNIEFSEAELYCLITSDPLDLNRTCYGKLSQERTLQLKTNKYNF